MVFEDNNPGIFEFKEEDSSVTGILIKIQEDVGPENSMLYTLEVEGRPTSIWGSVILNQRMIGIKLGDLIKITFKGLGEAKPGRKAPKIFKVEVDRNPEVKEEAETKTV